MILSPSALARAGALALALSVSSGAAVGRWAWGSNFVDLNNDGRLDLATANGFLTTDDDGDL